LSQYNPDCERVASVRIKKPDPSFQSQAGAITIDRSHCNSVSLEKTIMKTSLLFILCSFVTLPNVYSQNTKSDTKAQKAIYALIDAYSQARETKDTALLNSILADDIDQLVSSGTWRKGKDESMVGMMQSSTSNPGTRTLTIETLRFLDTENAIVDCRYEIKNPDGTERKMWSTFIVILKDSTWKITAIRNMLPARPQ